MENWKCVLEGKRTNKEVGALADLLDELFSHVARRVRAVDEREHAALAARLDQTQRGEQDRRGRRDYVCSGEKHCGRSMFFGPL